MRFESGMLGFLIVVLAIGGGIAGTFLLSGEETSYEVTRYNLLADATGLFDTDESPQYFDYDLSKNYTGYYTENTVINGVPYWGGATFTQTGVNNYPVWTTPSSDTSGTYHIGAYNGSLTESEPPYDNYVMSLSYYYQETVPNSTSGFAGKSVTVQSVINALGLNTYDIVTLSSQEDSNPANFNKMVFFGSVDDYYGTHGSLVKYVAYQYYNNYPSDSNYNIVSFSCKVNLITNNVDLYYGKGATQNTYVRSIDLDKATVIYADWGHLDSHQHEVIDVTANNNPSVSYMDISRGVTITGVTP